MRNEAIFSRLFLLWSAVCKMIVDGVRDAEEVANVLQGIVDGSAKATKEVVNYLRRLFTFPLAATAGTDLKSAKKEFRAYFDPDFENRGIIFSGVAPEVEIAGDELIQNGKFSDFLGKTATELEQIRLLGSQFLALCRDNPERLRGEGYANFFVLTRGDEKVAEDLSNVFVAGVRVRGRDELDAYLHEGRGGGVWGGDCRRRVFSPQ